MTVSGIDLQDTPGTMCRATGDHPSRDGAAGNEDLATRPPRLILVRGTQVATTRGDMAVEDITPGLGVMTRDAGMQPVLDVTFSAVLRSQLIASRNLTPILIGAGAFADGMPLHHIWVHPQTLVFTARDRSLGRRASDLVGDTKVARVFPDSVSYVALHLPVAAELIVGGVGLGPLLQ